MAFFLFFDWRGFLLFNLPVFLSTGLGIYLVFFREGESPIIAFFPYLLFAFAFYFILTSYLFRNHIRKTFKKRYDISDQAEKQRPSRENGFLGSQVYNLRMTPHFLFNSLMTLRIYMESEREDSVDYLDSLSNMLRYSFRFVDQDRVSLREELDFTLAYFDLVKNKGKNSFRIIIKKEVDIEIGEIFIPPFLIQTLVENSVKHAVMKSKQSIIIEVEIGREYPDRIRIVVQDNGPGAKVESDFAEGTFFYLRRRLKEICLDANLNIQSEIGNGFKTEISFYNSAEARQRKKSLS